MRKIIFASLATFLVGSIYAHDAHASNPVMFTHGSACYGVTGTNGGSLVQLTVDQYGIHNPSNTTSYSVICPLSLAVTDSFMSSVTIYVWGETNTAVTCNVYGTDEYGDILFSQGWNATPNGNAQVHEWSIPVADDIRDAFFMCQLPPANGFSMNYVASYAVQ
jgi:hypothetical protein